MDTVERAVKNKCIRYDKAPGWMGNGRDEVEGRHCWEGIVVLDALSVRVDTLRVKDGLHEMRHRGPLVQSRMRCPGTWPVNATRLAKRGIGNGLLARYRDVAGKEERAGVVERLERTGTCGVARSNPVNGRWWRRCTGYARNLDRGQVVSAKGASWKGQCCRIVGPAGMTKEAIFTNVVGRGGGEVLHWNRALGFLRSSFRYGLTRTGQEKRGSKGGTTSKARARPESCRVVVGGTCTGSAIDIDIEGGALSKRGDGEVSMQMGWGGQRYNELVPPYCSITHQMPHNQCCACLNIVRPHERNVHGRSLLRSNRGLSMAHELRRMAAALVGASADRIANRIAVKDAKSQSREPISSCEHRLREDISMKTILDVLLRLCGIGSKARLLGRGGYYFTQRDAKPLDGIAYKKRFLNSSCSVMLRKVVRRGAGRSGWSSRKLRLNVGTGSSERQAGQFVVVDVGMGGYLTIHLLLPQRTGTVYNPPTWKPYANVFFQTMHRRIAVMSPVVLGFIVQVAGEVRYTTTLKESAHSRPSSAATLVMEGPQVMQPQRGFSDPYQKPISSSSPCHGAQQSLQNQLPQSAQRDPRDLVMRGPLWLNRMLWDGLQELFPSRPPSRQEVTRNDTSDEELGPLDSTSSTAHIPSGSTASRLETAQAPVQAPSCASTYQEVVDNSIVANCIQGNVVTGPVHG
ncbi:hypothetical protein BKA70DRAFT_1402932 [Coprinopsis sp. MPI-PUGE-AT-0042]|nr:hypothetical protein BKA70DRAFT_1402932 [Coprinopsis sp. MPI-PUGE-AT-0042]